MFYVLLFYCCQMNFTPGDDKVAFVLMCCVIVCATKLRKLASAPQRESSEGNVFESFRQRLATLDRFQTRTVFL